MEELLGLDFFLDQVLPKQELALPPINANARTTPTETISVSEPLFPATKTALSTTPLEFQLEQLDGCLSGSLFPAGPRPDEKSQSPLFISDSSSVSTSDPGDAATDKNLIQESVTGNKRPAPEVSVELSLKKSKKLQPSRFCHICGKKPHCTVRVCTSIETGTCQKIVCTNCIHRFHLSNARDAWRCCHCLKTCPTRAQCHYYGKTNRARHLRIAQTKSDDDKPDQS
eukprot:Plantae.Rhodophyta-Rhodochaete_pulchella.ctg22114.p1 GENE.Plantae.Rhodophyta-Rhodochaete_pulchella.ctg22114~~Plantae.Rhodophyta-Rhodochaete_pulchella.ctg22114.p1  ORF type:complete len:227 (+),score=19.52 Plantae.Rhodophyta-Rhodochaete_pulchella.ctg22114:738-1418(+)